MPIDDVIADLPFQLTPFVTLNVLALLIEALCFVRIYRHSRAEFLRPSLLVVFFSFLFFAVSLTLRSPLYFRLLGHPYLLPYLVHGFILGGLLLNARKDPAPLHRMWRDITVPSPADSANCFPFFALLMLAYLAVLAGYLWYVPFHQTGLYALIFDPSNADIAREKSVKLLDPAVPRYLHGIMVSALGPLLMGLVTQLVLDIAKTSFRRRSIRPAELAALAGFAAVAIFLMVTVTISGARSWILNLMVVAGLIWFWRAGLPLTPLRLLGGIALILTPPIIITLVREGRGFSEELVVGMISAILHRAFCTPIDVGYFYLDYVERSGTYFGLAGIPKLAALVGVPSYPVPNWIGLEYVPTTFSSVNAGTGYLFSYFANFGWPSLFICLALLPLLDVVLYLYKRVDRVLLVPCVAANTLAALSFLQSDFTTAWITHGFLLIPLVASLMTWSLQRNRVRPIELASA